MKEMVVHVTTQLLPEAALVSFYGNISQISRPCNSPAPPTSYTSLVYFQLAPRSFNFFGGADNIKRLRMRKLMDVLMIITDIGSYHL